MASGKKVVGGVTCHCGSPQAYFMSVALCYISVSYPDIGYLSGGFITLVGSTCAGVSHLPSWQPTWPSLSPPGSLLHDGQFCHTCNILHMHTVYSCTHLTTLLLDLCPTLIVTLVSFCLNSCLLFIINHLLFHLYHASFLFITAIKPGRHSHIVTYSTVC